MLYSIATLLRGAAPQTADEVVPTAQIVVTVVVALASLVAAALALRLIIERRWQEEPNPEPEGDDELPGFGEPPIGGPNLRFPLTGAADRDHPRQFDSDAGAALRTATTLLDSVVRIDDAHAMRLGHVGGPSKLHRITEQSSQIDVPMAAASGSRWRAPASERRNGTAGIAPLGEILQWQEKRGSLGLEPVAGDDVRHPAPATPVSGPSGAPSVVRNGPGFAEPTPGIDQPRTSRSPLPAGREPGSAADQATIDVITQLVRDLMYCANSGELLLGFALYSESFLFRFMDATGFDEVDFRAAYGTKAARPRSAWERLEQLTEVQWKCDGRIEATADYVDYAGERVPTRERFRFVYVESQAAWRVDDIVHLPLDPR